MTDEEVRSKAGYYIRGAVEELNRRDGAITPLETCRKLCVALLDILVLQDGTIKPAKTPTKRKG